MINYVVEYAINSEIDNRKFTVCYQRFPNLGKNTIPKKTGTYIITHTPDFVDVKKYVGCTENLHNRMHGHTGKNIMYVDLFVMDSYELASSLERILIELLKPASNKITYGLSDEEKILMNKMIDVGIFNIEDKEIKIGCRYLKYIKSHKCTKISRPYPLVIYENCIQKPVKIINIEKTEVEDFVEHKEDYMISYFNTREKEELKETKIRNKPKSINDDQYMEDEKRDDSKPDLSGDKDFCLVEEIKSLEKEGVTIHFSVCNKGDRFIVTSNRDTLKMKELVYKINGEAYSNDKTYNSYEPKSLCTFEYIDDDEEDLEDIEEENDDNTILDVPHNLGK